MKRQATTSIAAAIGLCAIAAVSDAVASWLAGGAR